MSPELAAEYAKIIEMRREAIKYAERFLAHNRVPSHMQRSTKATIATHRASIAELSRQLAFQAWRPL